MSKYLLSLCVGLLFFLYLHHRDTTPQDIGIL